MRNRQRAIGKRLVEAIGLGDAATGEFQFAAQVKRAIWGGGVKVLIGIDPGQIRIGKAGAGAIGPAVDEAVAGAAEACRAGVDTPGELPCVRIGKAPVITVLARASDVQDGDTEPVMPRVAPFAESAAAPPLAPGRGGKRGRRGQG